MKIMQKKLKGKTDSFFYEGDIAEGRGKNGVLYKLIAAGDIEINIGQDFFSNVHVQDAIEKYKLTDRKLKSLLKAGKLEWLMNNWFEVVWLEDNPKSGLTWECDIGVVEYDYDSAIGMLKDYINEKH